MKIQDLMATFLADSREIGMFSFPELLRFAGEGRMNGIAVALGGDSMYYLAIISGETEGAVYTDEKGELYGDKAAIMISGRENFVLYQTDEKSARELAMRCRIFEKVHLGKNAMDAVPQIGIRGAGLGVLTITVRRDTTVQKGVRVSLRKEGQIVGSDITSGDGNASFRAMYGSYDCIIQDRRGAVTTFPVIFDGSHSNIVLDL
jgi:hypothetical protein